MTQTTPVSTNLLRFMANFVVAGGDERDLLNAAAAEIEELRVQVTRLQAAIVWPFIAGHHVAVDMAGIKVGTVEESGGYFNACIAHPDGLRGHWLPVVRVRIALADSDAQPVAVATALQAAKDAVEAAWLARSVADGHS